MSNILLFGSKFLIIEYCLKLLPLLLVVIKILSEITFYNLFHRKKIFFIGIHLNSDTNKNNNKISEITFFLFLMH
jgi:hypothetical protein